MRRASCIKSMRAPATRSCSRLLLRSTTTTTTDIKTTEASTVEPTEEKKPLPEGLLSYTEPTGSDRFWTSLKLCFALPWRRFKKDSVLVFKLEGEVSDQSRGRFDKGLSLPSICSALEKAALDPRVKGIAVEIGPLSCGWAKAQEVRRYLSHFRSSGKFSICFMKQGGEKEYYLASAIQEVFIPPSASLSLRGFSVSGGFLRGVLDKIGVEPQVKRIGDYKSAGDQILRTNMSQYQELQLQEILDDIYDEFCTSVAQSRGKTVDEVKAMLDQGIFDNKVFLEGGWVDGLRYEDEVIADLKTRTNPPDADQSKVQEQELKKVALSKYRWVNPSAFALTGKKKIAVLRTSGAIVSKSSTGGAITPDGLIPQLRSLAKNKAVSAVVLRVDSPGGDALASDLMWREIQKLSEKKPVVASMGDVAASGGYYLSMGAKTIVADSLTLTGSIGVVTGKFSLSELYQKIGYSKKILSRGRYAEILAADNRSFTGDENALFDRAAIHAYESFRNKAAASRGMSEEKMQEVAQGRVWTGKDALDKGLIDAIGGVNRAVAIAKQLAGIQESEKVTVLEFGRVQQSPLALLSSGASLSSLLASVVGIEAANILSLLQSRTPSYLMTEIDSSQLAGEAVPSSTSSVFLSEQEDEDKLTMFLNEAIDAITSK